MWSPQMESSLFQTVPMDSTWTPHGVYGDYWEIVGNASTGFHGVLVESLWSPHGVHVDSLWTPQSLHGLHGNPWGSVKCSTYTLESKYKIFSPKFTMMTCT